MSSVIQSSMTSQTNMQPAPSHEPLRKKINKRIAVANFRSKPKKKRKTRKRKSCTIYGFKLHRPLSSSLICHPSTDGIRATFGKCFEKFFYFSNTKAHFSANSYQKKHLQNTAHFLENFSPLLIRIF